MALGWNGKDTHRVVAALHRSYMYDTTISEAVYRCEQQGMSKDDAIADISSLIENLVESELLNANIPEENEMAQQFLPHPSDLDVDYDEIAEEWLSNYEPARSGNRRPQQSKGTKKAPAKKTSKPRTSGKKPAARPANRRR